MKKLDPNTPLSVILWLVVVFLVLMAVGCVGAAVYGVITGA